MSKIFVIAGTVQQAEQWIKGNLEKRKNDGVTTLSWSDYVIVRDPTKLRGYSNPHGVFIGTWKERKDMEEIFQQLLMSHDITQNSHRTINQLWGEWKTANPKPTPKLKKWINGSYTEVTDSYINSAANQLAKDIDRQVLESMNVVSYESLTPHIISAIQELKKEIDQLKANK